MLLSFTCKVDATHYNICRHIMQSGEIVVNQQCTMSRIAHKTGENMQLGLIIGAVVMIFVSTTAGAAMVFILGEKSFGGRAASLFSGFASGIMVAASVWSLIIPAVEQSSDMGKFSFVPAAVGVITGGLFILLLDAITAKLRRGESDERRGLSSHGKMMIAMTVHNIPEGLAVGLALGAALPDGEAALLSAFGLAVGIAVQNFPEGAAVALPMRTATGSAKKAFLLGSASGAVEPLFAGVGLLLAAVVRPLQPWLLAFAAGAMIFVVAEELIPDSRFEMSPHTGALGFLAGFVIMMILDIALG